MRRKDREITTLTETVELLKQSKVMRLGLVDEGYAYIVPLSFGYEVVGEQLKLYFHSAKEGKKIDLLRENGKVSFEVDTLGDITTGEDACEYSCLFGSVMGRGTAAFVEDEAEKLHALQRIMAHQAGEAEYSYDKRVVDVTAVVCITVESLSGKAKV